MAVFLSPVGGVAAQFFDNNGVPLTGGKLHTYEAGTTTNQATYTSSSGGTAHTNPIILDSAGRVPSGEIWLNSQPYKFILKTSTDVLVATWDNISGIGAEVANIAIFNGTGTGSQTIFSLGGIPLNENATDVYINGVYQQKNTYSVSSGVLTFSEAPPLTSLIEVTFNV